MQRESHIRRVRKAAVALLPGVVLLLMVWLISGAGGAKSVPKVWCEGVTNDASGRRVVTLVATMSGPPRACVVMPVGMDLKRGGVWQTNLPLPAQLKAEVELVPFTQEWSGAEIHVPTNAPWRIRWEVVETRHGMAGLVERLRYPQSYRKRGGLLNVLAGRHPSRYTGEVWYFDSGKLP